MPGLRSEGAKRLSDEGRHVHVVPRTKGDGLRGFFWPRTRYASEEEAAEYAQRIRDAVTAVAL